MTHLPPALDVNCRPFVAHGKLAPATPAHHIRTYNISKAAGST